MVVSQLDKPFAGVASEQRLLSLPADSPLLFFFHFLLLDDKDLVCQEENRGFCHNAIEIAARAPRDQVAVGLMLIGNFSGDNRRRTGEFREMLPWFVSRSRLREPLRERVPEFS